MPLFITFLRFVLIVPTLYALETDRRLFASFFILLAGISDWLDGDLARRNKKVTNLGILLDPLVDKAFVLSVLSFFLYRQEIGLVPFVLLLLRELAISFLRSLSVEKGYSMPASYLGKAKAFLEFVTLLSLSLSLGLSNFFLWLAIILAYLSMYDYIIKYMTYNKGIK